LNETLEPLKMIELYAQGAFPMADEQGKLEWFLPQTRAIIPLDNYNIPRTLKQFIRRNNFEIKVNKQTMEVVKACAERSPTWISDELIKGYEGLQKLGFLHSVEVYSATELVGGLYGVTFKGAFFGESMFSRVSQASKMALAFLLKRLKDKGFVLLDVQFITEHLKMFGAVEISFDRFVKLLIKAYEKNVTFD